MGRLITDEMRRDRSGSDWLTCRMAQYVTVNLPEEVKSELDRLHNEIALDREPRWKTVWEALKLLAEEHERDI